MDYKLSAPRVGVRLATAIYRDENLRVTVRSRPTAHGLRLHVKVDGSGPGGADAWSCEQPVRPADYEGALALGFEMAERRVDEMRGAAN